MNRALGTVIAVAVVAGAAAIALYLWKDSHPPLLPPPPRVEAPAQPAAPAGPRNPVVIETPEKPLPPLKMSDGDVREALGGALPPSAIERLVFEDFIRRVVATVDNLPREQYAARLNPVQAVPGVPRTVGKDNALTWSPDNAMRYAPFMAAFDAVDTAKLVAVYRKFYPLFQEAYVELGYPDGYFNDRLVEAIDNLLATPEVRGPIALVQPKVLYEFADPDLQRRSAGQKVLIRVGPDNAAKIKAKLRDFRSQVARVP
jgi:hypothetical protein